jgi:hypothetical protein
MKLIDHTPLQNENSEIGIVQRVQGTLKFGLSWYPELEAQKFALALLERGLGKGYTVIRNRTLGASGITIPLIIVGPGGIFAAYVTHLRGTYQAKGDSWGTISGQTFKPVAINLLTRTERMARALQAFIERQGVKLPQPVEPVLFTANPGMHVQSTRPIVRVVMVDAIEHWAVKLREAAPVFTVESAYELVDRVINPRPPKKEEEPEAIASSSEPESVAQAAKGEEGPELSRAGAIFRAADEAETFDPTELGFAFEEDSGLEVPPELIETSPAVPLSAKDDTKKRYLGMTVPQLALLAGMFLVEICVLAGFAIILYLNS